MKRRTKIAIGAGAFVVVAATAGFIVKGKNGKRVEVTTAKVERANIVSKVSANGHIEAKRKVDLSANIMGQIVNLAVREGDVVAKGNFLLQIDRAQHIASAAGAEASLSAFFHDREAAVATAEERAREFERAQRNHTANIVPLAELERAKSALDAARANVAAIEGRVTQARANLAGVRDTLSKTTIRAPMSGIVTRLPVEEGEVAVIGTMNNPGTVLMTISDMSVVEAVMEVDETDIPNVKIGQNATVTIDAYPNRTLTGTVTEVGSSPIERAVAGTEAIVFEVKITLDNPPTGVRPGFSSSAEIVTGAKNNVVAIPIQALVVREKPGAAAAKPQEEEGVFAYDSKSQKVKFQQVQTGLTGETSIEITKGLEPGGEIVTGPFRALRDIKDGDKVKPGKPEKEKSPDERKS